MGRPAPSDARKDGLAFAHAAMHGENAVMGLGAWYCQGLKSKTNPGRGLVTSRAGDDAR